MKKQIKELSALILIVFSASYLLLTQDVFQHRLWIREIQSLEEIEDMLTHISDDDPTILEYIRRNKTYFYDQNEKQKPNIGVPEMGQVSIIWCETGLLTVYQGRSSVPCSRVLQQQNKRSILWSWSLGWRGHEQYSLFRGKICIQNTTTTFFCRQSSIGLACW